MDRLSAYDLREANTPASVGVILSDRLQTLAHSTNEDMAVEMQEFTDPDGRFYSYAQLHGWYKEIADANQCFDLKSEENLERLSAYDLRTALYRYCKILGATPIYTLPDGTKLSSPQDVDNNLADKRKANYMRNELRSGSLGQWLSVFYHEDPAKTFEEEYSYEQELERWVLELGTIDQQNLYYKRLTKARQDTEERIASVRRDWNIARYREYVSRYGFYGLAGVWTALILFFGISDRTYIMAHPYVSILFPLGFMSTLVVAMRAFFHGYGPLISLIFGLSGAVTAFIPLWTLKFVDANFPSLFNITIILFTILYVFICIRTDYRGGNKTSAKMIKEILSDNDISTSLLEPLYYSFKTKSFRYKSTKFGLLDDITNQIRSTSGETVAHYAIWSLLVLVLILEFVVFSPKMLNMSPPFGDSEVKQVFQQIENKVSE